MGYDLQQGIALLERTPAALDALLRGLPQVWTDTSEGGNTWTVSSVIAHLIYGEQEDWMPRTRHILQSGDTQPFAAFDREGHLRIGKDRKLTQLLDEFSKARTQSLNELKGLKLTPQDLQRRGRHPSLGSVSLSELLATWAAHDLTHLHQISRIMAHQLRDAVGPWARFLGVMHCAGHSEAA